MAVIAHISDLHFNGTEEHRARAAAVVDYLKTACFPNSLHGLLISGDVADEGLPEEYRELLATVDIEIPTIVLLGNHDDRAAYSSVALDRETTDPINTALWLDDLLLLALDSSIPGRSDGYLADGTLAWAAEQIEAASADTDVLIAFHHPATTIGLPLMDDRRQNATERLARLLRSHPNIVGTVCGHAHTPAVTTFADRPMVIAPGVSSTLSLPFEGASIVNSTQPPGLAFHIVDQHRLTSHFRSVTSW